MVKSIELNNFKAFKKSGNIEIKKINILVGPNSSGKSSFIKSLLTLKNSIENKDSDTVLGFDKEIGTFKTVVYNNDSKNKIGYKICLDNTGSKSILDKINIDITLLGILNNTKIESEDIKDYYNNIKSAIYNDIKNYIVDNIQFTARLNSKGRVYVDNFYINFTNEENYHIYKDRNSYYLSMNGQKIKIPNIIEPYKFYFKINKCKVSDLNKEELNKIALFEYSMAEVEKKINKFSNNIIHIEPLRNKFDRVEYVTNLKLHNYVGKKGENTTTSLLGINKREEDEEMKRLRTKDKINQWFNEFNLGESVDIESLGNDNYSLIITNKYTEIKSNIVDVGVGTSQLLPIIVESISSQAASILVIEEPETHIHPYAQSKLADLFVDCANKQNKGFIIETHSIFLISQIQILVAKGLISPKDVGIYYFSQDKNGSKATNMKLLDNGQFEEEWPSGFFDIHYELGKELFKLM